MDEVTLVNPASIPLESAPHSIFDHLKRKTKSEEIESQIALAEFYMRDESIPSNKYKAFALLQPALKENHPVAQFYMGEFYANGSVVRQNYSEAASWYRRAADRGTKHEDKGYKKAQFALGRLYAKGHVGGRWFRNRQMVKWYRLAANQGLAEAQHWLALCYGRGRGVFKDSVQSFKWTLAAAEQGLPISRCNAAICYGAGAGTESNAVKALELFAGLICDRHRSVQFANGAGYREEKITDRFSRLARTCHIELNRESNALLATFPDGTSMPIVDFLNTLARCHKALSSKIMLG